MYLPFRVNHQQYKLKRKIVQSLNSEFLALFRLKHDTLS